MRVRTLALNDLAFRNQQDWGKLPKEVDYAPAAPPFDLIILQNRMGFFASAERALFTAHKPLVAFEAQGVPRILIYPGDALETTATATATTATAITATETTRTRGKVPMETPAPVTMPPPGPGELDQASTTTIAAPSETTPTAPAAPAPSSEPGVLLPEVPPNRITTLPGQDRTR